MIHGKCAMLDTYLNPSGVVELVGMDFRTEPVPRGSLKYAVGLFDGEESAVAEHIDKISQTFGCNGREHVIDEHIDIFSLASCICASDCVCSEER